VVRSGQLRVADRLVEAGTMVAAGRDLDCAFLKLLAESTGQPLVLLSRHAEHERVEASGAVELLSISLQELVLLLGPSAALLDDERAKVHVLRGAPCLHHLSDAQLLPLCHAAVAAEWAAGDVIIAEGSPHEAVRPPHPNLPPDPRAPRPLTDRVSAAAVGCRCTWWRTAR